MTELSLHSAPLSENSYFLKLFLNVKNDLERNKCSNSMWYPQWNFIPLALRLSTLQGLSQVLQKTRHSHLSPFRFFPLPWLVANSSIPSKRDCLGLLMCCGHRLQSQVSADNSFHEYVCRVKCYCIITLKDRSFWKYLATAITCENFIHGAGRLCRQKDNTDSRQAFISSSTKTKSVAKRQGKV